MGEVVKVDETGAMSLPEDLRRKLGVEHGGALVVSWSHEGARLLTVDQSLRELQEAFRPFREEGVIASEALIADRRAEARRELIEAGLAPEVDE